MNPIITVPNLSLRQPSTPITTINRHLLRLLRELEINLAKKAIGVGLAAPQIGVNHRVLAIHLPTHSQNSKYHYFINPQITKKSSQLTLGSEQNKHDLEGCLSIPKIFAPIYRPVWLDLSYFTIKDNQLVPHTLHLTDFAARTLAHEYDHLDGVLFTDHALRQHQPLYHENNQGELEEITPAALFKLFGKF
jgi:peptide deformylase